MLLTVHVILISGGLAGLGDGGGGGGGARGAPTHLPLYGVGRHGRQAAGVHSTSPSMYYPADKIYTDPLALVGKL